MTRVLVTGAAGFVGANLARRLVSDGHEVHALVRPGRDAGPGWRLQAASAIAGTDPPDRAPALRVHPVDLRNASAVAGAVHAARPDWVFHCAAHGAYSWQRDETRIRETNVTGTANLLDACRSAGVPVFVNTGSSSEYGHKDHPASEDDVPEPNSAYAEAKLAATMQCTAAARHHAGRVVTLRLYSVYGPYEEPNRLFPTLLVSALAGTLPPLVSPDTARDFIHVDDVCDAYLQVAQCESAGRGAIFNVGSGTQTTIAEVVEIVRTMFGIAEPPRWGSMPPRAWDTNVWCANIAKIERDIGWRPRRSLADGLSRFAAWIVEHPDVRRRYESAIAPAVRLPS